MESKMTPSGGLILDINLSVMEHAFLPSILKGDPSNIAEIESHLLGRLSNVVQLFARTVDDDTIKEKIDSVVKTFETWENVQSQEHLEPKQLAKEINALEQGDLFGLYIRSQNAGIIISIPPTKTEETSNENHTNGPVTTSKISPPHGAVFATFAASPLSHEVTSSPGSLAAIFPTTALCIPKSDILNSKTFARQLSSLTSFVTVESSATVTKAGQSVAEVREVPDPFFVTQWLAAVLSDASSRPANSEQLPRVVKKIRDVVLYGDTPIPFRRSGLYMTAKIILQISLFQALGETEGLFAYKLIILKFLAFFLHENVLDLYGLPWVTMEMIGKVARRSRKLQVAMKVNFQDACNEDDKLKPYLRRAYDETLQFAAERMKIIHLHLKNDWNRIIERERDFQRKEFLLKGGKPIEVHRLNKSEFQQYICQTSNIFTDVAKQCIPPTPTYFRHRNSNEKFPDPFLIHPSEDELPYVLYDVEVNIKNWDYLLDITDHNYVLDIFRLYVKHSKPYYNGDPVGASRMILTCLKMIQIWDEIVKESYPMLLEHRPGVNLSFTKDLTIPDYDGMNLLLDLEIYFEERNNKAIHPSLVEEQEIFHNSFLARYGRSLPGLVEIRDLILEDAENQIELKIEELRVARKKCDQMNKTMKTMECEYEYTQWKRQHSTSCEKCTLVKQYRALKVKVFERPLPRNEECQFGVLAELILPKAIACLRDILFLFRSSVIGSIIPDSNKENQTLYGPWYDYKPLRRFLRRPPSDTRLVSLMSTKKLFLDSHYDSFHPTNPNSDFIRNNGYNCRIAGEGKLFVQSSSSKVVKSLCTFRVIKKTPYAKMQYAIDGDSVTPNQVLAKQNECDPDLTLQEFVEFGSLRCFKKLQLRNIYRAMTQMTLSLKNESVFNMICQCLWQVGPPLNEEDIELGMQESDQPDDDNQRNDEMLRQTFQDMKNSIFLNNFLDLVESYRLKQAHNWKDHYVLLALIAIVCRIVNLVQDGTIVEKGLSFLSRCRENAQAWSKEVREILATSTKAPRAEVDLLRVKMVEINVCCSLTFAVRETFLKRLLNTETITTWLLAQASIYDNVVLLGSGRKSQKEVVRVLPVILQNLMKRVHETGLVLEKYLRKRVKKGEQVFTEFVKRHYDAPEILEGINDAIWEPLSDTSHTFTCTIHSKQNTLLGQTTTLQMDIVGGGFLVDGSPISYLPGGIENHPLFQRTFPTKSFTVGPYPFQPGRMKSLESFMTSETDPKCFTNYSFFLQQGGCLIVTEHRYSSAKPQTYYLFPPHYLEKNIPHILIEDFTHWWNKETGIIEFYKRDRNNPSKLFLKNPSYILDLGSSKLIEISSEREMVDISCRVYEKISAILARLEHPKYINLWYDRSKRNHVVELPRMGLQFNVGNHNDVLVLTSKEYRGMKVYDGTDPLLATLVGLRNGLLLVDADIKSKTKLNPILLVPHGVPVIHGSNNVRIRNEVLRNPTFFAYEIDTRLKQLKAGESQAGWIFLAYLHAVTTSHMPDPFTEVTGTERAFQILQSGHCWSAQPMDFETLRTLQDIARLSPCRKYYPPNLTTMERVEWPLVGKDQTHLVELPPHVAHDGFQLIVEKLIRDSMRLHFLFKKTSGESSDFNFEFGGERDLCVKSYWRRIGLSTELGIINATFDESFDIIQAPQITPCNPFDCSQFAGDNFNNILDLAQLGHTWKCRLPRDVNGLLKKLLLTGDDLQGVSELGFTCKEDWRFWSDIDFRDSWLSLYKLATSCPKTKKEMCGVPEWIHLLTHLSFRSTNKVTIDHLNLLHTVAVNWDIFQSIEPPPYTEYFMTDEYDFNAEEIVNIFKLNAISWSDWMDEQERRGLREPYECQEDFGTRMESYYEEELKTLALDYTTAIEDKWPIDSCDQIFPEIDTVNNSFGNGIWTTIGFRQAILSINMMLRNWFRNSQLLDFIQRVELMIRCGNKYNFNKSQTPFQNTSRAWTRNISSTDRIRLDNFVSPQKSQIFTIKFVDIIGERPSSKINTTMLEDSVEIFNGRKKRKSGGTPQTKTSSGVNPSLGIEPFPLEMETSCPILEKYSADLKMSWNESQKRVDIQKSKVNVSELLNETSERASKMWELVSNIIRPIGNDVDHVTNMLMYSELFPRVTPLSLFPLICRKDLVKSPDDKYLNYIRNLLGAYGVLLTEDQRAARCFKYKMRYGKEIHHMELNLEQSNPGHENWNPSERPEWLLFELEMDLMVRPIQAKVAERMENPENGDNALLQLNMGEGKTAVIVPLLVLSLANGKRLCRVTVLKSLFEINQKALISRIGGLLLSRRVYTFPCRRDYEIGNIELKSILEVYKECKWKKGVVIGLAEHRLSFKLKAYETCGAENFEDGRQLLEIQNWLNGNARDVLDESDEILQVKYQLIYTLGKQMPICGGTSRWVIIQKVLRIVPSLIQVCFKKFGSGSVELSRNGCGPQGFPYCRLLKSDCHEFFNHAIVEEILSGNSGMPIPEVTFSKKALLVNFLTDEKIPREEINKVYKLYPLEAHQQILLILRGLLASGVLCSALTKRYRVNYGINPTGYRRMAVPFRAKDLAAERTEFGHPDIGIVLTQLCYYYSGLNETQLEQCFVNLFLQPDPPLEYQRWIELVPKDLKGYETIRHLSGVNLKDFFQRTKILYPALEKNVATVDFWLGTVVFPHESKQFGWKIGCSPWDLCAENASHPTTGFSGTNDSKLLLPKTICQKDLPELQGTNGEVLRNLLRKENNTYEALPLGCTGKKILNKLVHGGIRLLLDVGALMLELNNEQVAKTWLELENEHAVDAAVYFDNANKLVVIDRITKVPVNLETSSYRTRLDSCVIYLDDAHTRGTDLKIPAGVKGCVTLGKGVTKDKLVQGCMRMRKLGQGHTVTFWASHEVDNLISSLVNFQGTPGSKQVLQWAIENSRSAIEEGFIHWAVAGVYQAQKLASHVIFDASKKTNHDLKLLADGCSEKESTELMTMYGEVRSVKKFPVIVKHLLNRVNRELQKRLSRCNGGTSAKVNVNNIVESFGQVVITHSEQYVPEITRLSQCLEEEQERELEHEQEAEHEKEPPAKIKAYDHSISEGVTNFVMTGSLKDIEKWAVQLPLVLKNTRLWNKCATDTWGQHIYASHDFKRVARTPIQNNTFEGKTEEILRPLQWLCSVPYDSSNSRSERTMVLLLISSYEANHYLTLFRSGTAKAVLHMFAGRLCPDQDTLYRNPELTIPLMKLPREIPSSHHSALLIFSGSSYFADKVEQDDYCKFAGYCLKERTRLEDQVFQQGGIINGFVEKKYLQELGYTNCRFDKNPEALIKGIIELRNGSFYNDSHVGRILLQHTKSFQN